MLFGVEQRGETVDELTEYLQDVYGDTNRELDSIRERASQTIEKSQSYNLKYFNEHHKQPKTFSVGDLVVLKNVDTGAGVNKKLIPKYRGPYIIQKQLGNDRYEITDAENCQVTQMPYVGIVDSSRLKNWLELGNVNGNILENSEGNTYESKDYEYLDKASSDCEYEDYEFLDEKFL